MKKQHDIVIDSDVSLKVALAQNPQSPAPQSVLNAMKIINVAYYGFDSLLHHGQIVIHEDVIEDVKKFFKLALELKFPIKCVVPISNPKYRWDDETSCGDNNSSGFNYRYISGNQSRLSKHASGLAFDINPVQNIYIQYSKNLKEIFRSPASGVYNKKTPGTLTFSHPLVILMKKLGWDWGGDWTPKSGRKDYQHFEKKFNSI